MEYSIKPTPSRFQSTNLTSVSSGSGKKESRRPVAHECLGEVLRVLRQVINTYPLLNTVEILTAAGKLISKVKGQSNAASTTPRAASLTCGVDSWG